MDRFVEELIRELSVVLDGTYSMVRVDTRKNNGVLLDGIRFDKKDDKVSPVVYVGRYYEEYTDGSMTMEMIITSIVKQLSEKQDVEDIANKLQQYNLIKDELVFTLLNYDLNREILEERPHKKFLDLAAVCMVRVETKDGLNGIVYVTHHEYQTEQTAFVLEDWERFYEFMELLESKKLKKLLGKLKEHERRILFARIFGELTFEEMGEKFGMKPKQAEMAFYYILRKLRKELEGDREDEF